MGKKIAPFLFLLFFFCCLFVSCGSLTQVGNPGGKPDQHPGAGAPTPTIPFSHPPETAPQSRDQENPPEHHLDVDQHLDDEFFYEKKSEEN